MQLHAQISADFSAGLSKQTGVTMSEFNQINIWISLN